MKTPASLVQLVTRIKWITCPAPSLPQQESAPALFSQEEKWTVWRHAPSKDYISEASAFNRRAGGSEIVTTQTVCRGFKDVSALQATKHVGAISQRHQLQLCGGNVCCMAGKSQERAQGAVCFRPDLQKPQFSLKPYNDATSKPPPNLLHAQSEFMFPCSKIAHRKCNFLHFGSCVVVVQSVKWSCY